MVYLYPPGDSQQTPAADAAWFLRPPNACDSRRAQSAFHDPNVQRGSLLK